MHFVCSWTFLCSYKYCVFGQIESLVTEVQSLRGEIVSAEERETTLHAQYV